MFDSKDRYAFNLKNIPPSRPTLGNGFNAGVLDFNLEVSQDDALILSDSFFQIEMEIETDALGDGVTGAGAFSSPAAAVTAAADVPRLAAAALAATSFADNAAAALFRTVEARVGNIAVSSISQSACQAHQVVTRTSSSGAWLENAGSSVYGMKPVSVAGGVPVNANRGAKKRVMIYRPSIGIFSEKTPLGNGRYTISLTPNENYVSSCLVSTYDPKYLKINVKSIRFMAAMIKTAPRPDGTTYLNLYEQQVSSEAVVAGVNELTFNVPTTTKAITVFVADGSAGNAVAKGGNAPFNRIPMPLTLFKTQTAGLITDDDLKVKTLTVNYAGLNKPLDRLESSYVSADNDKCQGVYNETYRNCGLLLHNSGGPESYEDFKMRGKMYHYDFYRGSGDGATVARIKIDMASAAAGARCFICAHHTRVVEIVHEHGFVTNVETFTK